MERGDLNTRLDEILVGGRERRPIVILEHDPAWLERFVHERERIASALGSTALRIDHIGSTAVPGLAAKPIVDILVAVRNVEDEASYRPALEISGYELRVREEGHRMFRTPDRGVHVHLWPADDEEVRRHLLFRDWLRFDTADRQSYEALKRSLAEREWEDMNHYAQAKGPLIVDIMVRAESWASSTGWAPRR